MHRLKKQGLQPFIDKPFARYTDEGMNEISSFPTRAGLSLRRSWNLDDFDAGDKSTRLQDDE
jgi:hypothetical protein